MDVVRASSSVGEVVNEGGIYNTKIVELYMKRTAMTWNTSFLNQHMGTQPDKLPGIQLAFSSLRENNTDQFSPVCRAAGVLRRCNSSSESNTNDGHLIAC